MHFETIYTQECWPSFTITLHRSVDGDSINLLLFEELYAALAIANNNPDCRYIVLKVENDLFFTNTDFNDNVDLQEELNKKFCENYMALLKYFTSTDKIIITLLDGQVLAGGLGFAAVSDLVFSSEQTQFSISETPWGLLPASVMPFLIRRIGFQKAYYMSLTTQTIDANTAQKIGLVDELTDDFSSSLQRLYTRLQRIHSETISDLKKYFRRLWLESCDW